MGGRRPALRSLAARLSDGNASAHVVGFGAFLLVYAYLLRGITVGRLYTFGDFAPFYGATGLAKLTHLWVEQGLGFSYIYHVLPAYMGAITLVGGVIGQNLLFLSFIPAGYLAFLLFTGRFVRSVTARHLAAFVYAINPLVVGEFVNGGVAALVGYAGLPVLLHYLYDVADTGSWESTLKAAAVFGATTISIWLGFWMVAPFAALLAWRTRRQPGRVVKLCVSGLLGLLLALPSVHHVIQRALGLDSGQAVLQSTFWWNYADADLFPLLRLAGNNGVMVMNRLGYNTDPEMMVGLIVPGVALLAIHRRQCRPYYLIAVIILAFLVLTKQGFTTVLFETIPPLWSLRNPVKLQYPLLVCLGLLFGAGMETVLSDRRHPIRAHPPDGPPRRRSLLTDGGSVDRSQVVVVGVVVLCLLSYAAPASGALGLDAVRGDDYYVPQDQEALAERLDGTVLWVPYEYTTQLRLRHTYPDHLGIKSGGVLHGIQNTEFVGTVYERFVDDPDSVRPLLAASGVEYVVVDGDPPEGGRGDPRVVERWGAPWVHGSPARFDGLLNESRGYELAIETEQYHVYRVLGARSPDRFEREPGVQRLYYPTSDGPVETSGDNLVTNGEFDDGLDEWWTWTGSTGTQTTVVEDGGDPALRMETTSGSVYPIAQSVDVRDEQPYRLRLEAEGQGKVFLYWYNGTASADGLVARESYALGELPRTVFARGDQLSIRIRPNGTRLTVDSVDLQRARYPREVGFGANVEGIPGVAVDGYRSDTAVGTAVAINMNPRAAERVGASVRVRDAETVLDGELVFDRSYRQGVGVLLSPEALSSAVPEDANPVTRDHPRGTVLDYWVVGEFDRQEATVLYTSYDRRWTPPEDASHFRAYGWANGYVGAEPDEVHWTGGAVRRGVAAVWGSSWVGVIGAAAVLWIRGRRGSPAGRGLRRRLVTWLRTLIGRRNRR